MAAKNHIQKIIFATVQFRNIHSGPGTFTNYIYNHFKNEGRIFFYVTEDIEKNKTSENVFKVRIPKNLLFSNRLVKGIFYYIRIKNIIKKHKPEIIWFNTSPIISFLPSVLLPEKTFISMISDYNNVLFSGTENVLASLKKKIFQIIEKAALKRSEKVIVNSVFLKNLVNQKYNIPENKIAILYKGVDLGLFEFKEPSSLQGKEIIKILFVKSDFKTGGLLQLIEAISLVSFSSELTIVGPSEKNLREITGFAKQVNYRGKILFKGKQNKEELKNLYYENDLLCVPSVKEAFGVVFLEGMSCGISVIGSNAGGIPEVLDWGKAGWMAEPENIIELKNILEHIVLNDSERIRKIKYGRKYVEKFSIQNMEQDFFSIINNISK
jgi:glycosyltransferase involved in cell wall biosynthesis